MDIFQKCFDYSTVKRLEEIDLFPYFQAIDSGQDPTVMVNGREMIMVGSNNYLGLTSHPKLKEAANRATDIYGVGCVGSRFLNGTLSIHEQLEQELADFMNTETAVVFTTGMQTNLGVISSIVGRHDVVITDKFDHASIIDGCRLALGKMFRYKHNDMDDLRRVLGRLKPEQGCLVVVDGVFSMEGDIADLPGIIPVVKEFGAKLMVDDAHGLGVLGANGRGTCEHFGVEDEVDIIMASFSKAFACIGGFVAADKIVADFIKYNARSMVFSASPPPNIVASILAALEIVKNEPERRKQVMRNAERMKKGLQSYGFDTGATGSPIIPVMIGDDMAAFSMWRMLFDGGIFCTPVVSPAVPEDHALIRVSCMATHTDEQTDTVIEAFAEAGRELGLI
ncbi:MAG: pyridoxal phosphate-dependent aminotransferase family protein [bacterium]|nr:pyridoxal phosphate-dependent aminotransferase family protein [bacterium]